MNLSTAALTDSRGAHPTGAALILVRLEALAVLVAAVVAYAHLHFSWLLFAVLLLAPDLAMLGYLAGPRVGAICYNMVHTYIGPLVLLALSTLHPALQPFALIWATHIALDRALGYGLKYATGFNDTHLGRTGRVSPRG